MLYRRFSIFILFIRGEQADRMPSLFTKRARKLPPGVVEYKVPPGVDEYTSGIWDASWTSTFFEGIDCAWEWACRAIGEADIFASLSSLAGKYSLESLHSR